MMKHVMLGLTIALSSSLFAEPLKGIIDLSLYIKKSKGSPSLSLAGFKEMIKEGNVIVKYYAEWCGPCKQMGKTILEIANDYPDVAWVEVNVETFKSLSSGIRSIPTLVYYKNGKEIHRESGGKTPTQLRTLVTKLYA